MAARTVAPPPSDRRLWRLALARAHPDSGGSEELFVWMSSVMEHVIATPDHAHATHDDRPGAHENVSRHRNDLRERIPFDPHIDHHQRILYALRWYRDAAEPYRGVVMSLGDYPHAWHGRREAKQAKGATYKQLAFIAHLAGMSREERQEWYAVAESIGVSEAMASQIISRLKARRAAA